MDSSAGLLAMVVAAALSGGFLSHLLERRWKQKDKQVVDASDIKKMQMDESAAIREELRKELADVRAEMKKVEKEEDTWRIKYWEVQGMAQADAAELAALRPRFIELVQENQKLLAEVEVRRAEMLARRKDDRPDTSTG